MRVKKELMITVIAFLLVISLLNVFVSLVITGGAVSSTSGRAQICLNNPPIIVSIPDQSGYVDIPFSYQVIAADGNGNALSYFDNTSLFDIDPSGLISFTPNAALFTLNTTIITMITISVEDNSSCLNNRSSSSFTMTLYNETPPAEVTVVSRKAAVEGSSLPSYSFRLSEKVISVEIFPTQTLTKNIIITNDGILTLNMKIESSSLDLAVISPTSFSLRPNQQQELLLIINPEKKTLPGDYEARISFSGEVNNRFETMTDLMVKVKIKELPSEGVLPRIEQPVLPSKALEGYASFIERAFGAAIENKNLKWIGLLVLMIITIMVIGLIVYTKGHNKLEN